MTTERAYTFVSHWHLAAPAERCWAEVERMLTRAGSAWWPGVSVVEPAARVGVGERVTLRVRSPFGYRLRVGLILTDVGPQRIAATGSGDLAGTGAVDVRGGAASTALEIRWDVVTRRRWMNATAPVLRPAFSLAHALVMRAGERGLRRALGE